MYKCTECGQEFDIKPDYCDCGNDTFEQKVEPAPKMPEKRPEVPTPQVQTVRRTVDLPSLLIFFACIVLSILSLIFIGREGEKAKDIKAQKTPQVAEEMPSIDEIWKETKRPTIIEKIKEIPSKKSEILPKIQKKTAATVPVVKAKAKSAAQTATQTVKKTVTPAMTEIQKQEIIKKLTSTPQKQPVVEKQPVTVQTPTPKPEPKIDYAAQKRELAAYKVSLRNKIGASINFAAVIGDGKCAVTFKIDETGNLTSRKFSQQSQNDSLNDAVFAAMMQNPTFKAPPEGYKNETLTLSVKMYGGNFEVDLK